MSVLAATNAVQVFLEEFTSFSEAVIGVCFDPAMSIEDMVSIVDSSISAADIASERDNSFLLFLLLANHRYTPFLTLSDFKP